MYYRRKILLSILQIFGGSLGKIDFQKYLFLLNQENTEPFYEFIPYKYGCFSFQANQDLSTMVKYDLVEESETMWKLKSSTDQFSQLKDSDKLLISRLYKKYGDLKGNELIRYVYLNHPYYSIHSTIADKILDNNEYEKVLKSNPRKQDYALISIGYEGRTVEGFVNRLIMQDVRVLCDLRKNALSMKYGFSKKQLKSIVESIGIKYVHLPELGIESQRRKQLKSSEDHSALFKHYEIETLPANQDSVDKLLKLFSEEKRIAVMCFEKDHNCCHRSRTIDYLIKNYKRDFNVKYL